jgi:polyisoprenoid-binding protein YceI
MSYARPIVAAFGAALAAQLWIAAPFVSFADSAPVAVVVSASAGAEKDAPSLAAVKYHFGVSTPRTNIAFESRAELETIIGSSNELSGFAELDEKAGTISAELSVPVKSLKTGIDLRDEHLRSDAWLDADKFPNLVFKTTKAAKKKGEENIYVVDGDFTMHGKTKSISVEVKVKKISDEVVKKTRMEPGQWMKFSTSFTVKLSDFGVTIPEHVGPKVDDAWTVKFDAFASTVKGEK